MSFVVVPRLRALPCGGKSYPRAHRAAIRIPIAHDSSESFLRARVCAARCDTRIYFLCVSRSAYARSTPRVALCHTEPSARRNLFTVSPTALINSLFLYFYAYIFLSLSLSLFSPLPSRSLSLPFVLTSLTSIVMFDLARNIIHNRLAAFCFRHDLLLVPCSKAQG